MRSGPLNLSETISSMSPSPISLSLSWASLQIPETKTVWFRFLSRTKISFQVCDSKEANLERISSNLSFSMVCQPNGSTISNRDTCQDGLSRLESGGGSALGVLEGCGSCLSFGLLSLFAKCIIALRSIQPLR